MTPRSLSLSFRIPLAFHCLNNEGASGNVMEPRRITVQEHEYDGISGEMVRRHVLENFVRLCGERNIPLTDQCRGLAPERSRELLKQWVRSSNEVKTEKNVKQFVPDNYHAATDYIVKSCALSDLGGYLIPFESKDNIKGTLKRDSCFEFGWLITENPAIVEFTQGVAYNADPGKNNLFTQNMRVGVYSGVFRFDLGRVGVSDWAWLSNGAQASAIDTAQRNERIAALLDALEQWLLSPSGARQAGWLQHQSDMRDGIFCLSEAGPAPFVSPLSLDLASKKEATSKDANTSQAPDNPDNPDDTPVFHNKGYRNSLKALAEARQGKTGRGLTCCEFESLAELSQAFDKVRAEIGIGND